MRIAICGASGFVGNHLSSAFVSDSHEVVRIGREHFKNIEFLVHSLDGCDIVINLCGESFFKKWDELYKHELYVSRVETTKKIVKAISLCEDKPRKLIVASSIKIYKESLVHDEKSSEYCTDYLALLMKEYEQSAKSVEAYGVQTVILRIGYILGVQSPLLSEIKKLFRFGVGFIIGDGNQALSWVHVTDVKRFISQIINTQEAEGVYNVVAPENVKMIDFLRSVGKHLQRKIVCRLPKRILEFCYGEYAQSPLKGSFVISTRDKELGFAYMYENLDTALQEIYSS